MEKAVREITKEVFHHAEGRISKGTAARFTKVLREHGIAAKVDPTLYRRVAIKENAHYVGTTDGRFFAIEAQAL